MADRGANVATTRKSTNGGKTGGAKTRGGKTGGSKASPAKAKRKKAAKGKSAAQGGASDGGAPDGGAPNGAVPNGAAPKRSAAAKNGTGKGTGRTKAAAQAAAEATVDPRAPLPITPKNLEATLVELEAVIAKLEAPAEPTPIDLVDVLTHAIMSTGIPAGYAQEALRRIADEFVDRNEFRVTEAFEVERLLDDIDVPELFDRCRTIQQAVNQIYADQNKVALDHLREASVSDRKSFFQRIPAISNDVARYLSDYLAWEEVAFSPRSTQRVQQRLGLDPQAKADQEFVEKLRAVLAPFGHLPLRVGKDRADRKGVTDPVRSPADLLVRLEPAGKK